MTEKEQKNPDGFNRVHILSQKKKQLFYSGGIVMVQTFLTAGERNPQWLQRELVRPFGIVATQSRQRFRSPRREEL